MSEKYNKTEILENLSHIKALTNYETEYCKQTSGYFIIWGIIWIIVYITPILLPDAFTIGIVWAVSAVIGWGLTILNYYKHQSIEPTPLFLRTQLKFAWMGLLIIVSIFSSLIFIGLLPYSFDHFLFYLVLMIAIMYILLGIVLTKDIFLMGVWLSFVGVIAYKFFPESLNLIFAWIGGGSLLITGFILKRKGRKHE
ncbi:hypothetical protein [Salibacterium salarium]|nr:hypothetical protein [Salibacterium salarium]